MRGAGVQRSSLVSREEPLRPEHKEPISAGNPNNDSEPALVMRSLWSCQWADKGRGLDR